MKTPENVVREIEDTFEILQIFSDGISKFEEAFGISTDWAYFWVGIAMIASVLILIFIAKMLKGT